MLLAEQNTNMALNYASYGYILENGRVVMDGDAKSLRENEDVQGVLPRRRRRRPQELPRREVLQAAQALAGISASSGRACADRARVAEMHRRPLRRRRDDWIPGTSPGMTGNASRTSEAPREAMADHFDQLEIRDPEPAGAGAVQPAARSVRDAMAKAPGWADHLKGVDPAAVDSRGRHSPSCRCCASRRSRSCRPSDPPSAASRPRRRPSWRASSCRRGRSSSPRASARTGGARRARCSPPASARATSCTTRSPIT